MPLPRWPAFLSAAPNSLRLRALRPQLKRDPLGSAKCTQRKVYSLESQSGLPPAKGLFAANLIAATAAIIPPAYLAIDYVRATSDRGEILGYLIVLSLVCLPSAALLALTAAAHWRRWPLRWVLQSLAVALATVLGLLLLA